MWTHGHMVDTQNKKNRDVWLAKWIRCWKLIIHQFLIHIDIIGCIQNGLVQSRF